MPSRCSRICTYQPVSSEAERRIYVSVKWHHWVRWMACRHYPNHYWFIINLIPGNKNERILNQNQRKKSFTKIYWIMSSAKYHLFYINNLLTWRAGWLQVLAVPHAYWLYTGIPVTPSGNRQTHVRRWEKNTCTHWVCLRNILYVGFASFLDTQRRRMMTSSNGSIFRVTGPLWREFTGHRWIPITKASDAELWCFLWPAPEQTIK